MHNKGQIIFVIGLARSGTKLLRDLLNNHPDIYILPFETQFIPKVYSLYSKADLKNVSLFKKFYMDVSRSVYSINKSKRGEYFPIQSEWYSKMTRGTLSEALKVFYEITLQNEKPSACIAGDKTPRYTGNVDILLDLFPNAQFIHIVRDPRDRALSENKVWKKNIYKSVSNWSKVLEHLNYFVQKYPEKFIQIKYEDLLNDSNRVLTMITDRLNLDSSTNLLNINNPVEKYGDAKDRTDIMHSNSDKYKNSYSKNQIRRMEGYCYNMLIHYGYNSEYADHQNTMSFSAKKILGLFDKISMLIFYIKNKGLKQGTIYFWRMSR